MKRSSRFVLSLSIAGVLLLGSGAVLAAGPAAGTSVSDIQNVAALLRDGKVEQLHAQFNASMAANVSIDKLKGLWTQIESSAGKLKAVEPLVGEPGAPHQEARLQFENGTLKLTLELDAQGKVSGMWILPDVPVAVSTFPALTAQDPMTETVFELPAPLNTKLPATLTLPKNVVNPPAVVLVHGSGPHDRYETIAGNRPFLDIARGLARQGIAVLAYDKRTRAFPSSPANGTLNGETTDDAFAAAKWLMASGKVDPKRVFILGHSQGGMVTPAILLRDPTIRGGIMLAAPAVKLIDVLPHQNRTLLGNQVDTPQGKAHMQMITDGLRQIRDPKVAATTLVFNLPASYWRSVDAVDPLADAKRVKQPLLMVQGGKDFQVIRQDWSAWQSLAASKPKSVQFKLYPQLNHLALVSEDKPAMADYQTPRQVDPQLIADIANWIKTH